MRSLRTDDDETSTLWRFTVKVVELNINMVVRRTTFSATALLLAGLAVTKSHSRPYSSNDNPFSESRFRTVKYQLQFPERSVNDTPYPPKKPTAVWIDPLTHKLQAQA